MLVSFSISSAHVSHGPDHYVVNACIDLSHHYPHKLITRSWCMLILLFRRLSTLLWVLLFSVSTCMYTLLSTSVHCLIMSAPIVLVSVKCSKLATVYVSITLPHVSRTCDEDHLHVIRHTPLLSLMFLVFVARLYWLVSSVLQTFFSALASLSLVAVPVFCLFIFVVSASTLSLSVCSSRTCLWKPAWPRLRLQPYVSVLQPCVSRYRPTPAQRTRSWKFPDTPVYRLTTLDC